MILYPEQLLPETVETLHLPSGLDVQIPKAAPVFRSWSGKFTGDTYGNKPLLDIDGTPMFAELAILRLFQKDGWDGVWVDTFRKKYRGSPRRKGESVKGGPRHHNGVLLVLGWRMHLIYSTR